MAFVFAGDARPLRAQSARPDPPEALETRGSV